ncbi:hypothetical protein E1212_08055 [Jiangella ureilytica]|uniref:LVIVD repeat-containing protein n=1 Tax=Jiangella ureilytica TaxID=2530374 RepID=A0A4R4RT75_9ACTN|nr:hypothetical protein [Jiangella ureilytica]TDC52796.1 hypothetical protein E1212_08055 [Jiangella ureilytica]
MKRRQLPKALESLNMRLVGHTDFNGAGDGMHINLKDGYAFFGHMGNGGTSIVDVRDPSAPRPIHRIPAPPNTRSHKVQIVGDTLLVNRERLKENHGGTLDRPWIAGLSVYDVADPTRPREIGYWPCGGRGVHRMTYWSEPYAFVTSSFSEFDRGQGHRHGREILAILDLTDPARPVEVGRWWFPGMRYDEKDQEFWAPDTVVKLHHGVPRGNRLYCGWEGLGVVILDIEDISAPSLVAHLNVNEVDGPSRNTHTACPIPGRDLLVVTDECVEEGKPSIDYLVRLVDISDERNPRVVSRLPIPAGDYANRGGRFGSHNVHEMRPGSFQSSDLVFVTYFNAGVRVYDIADAANPREVAYFVPEPPPGRATIQLNDIVVGPDGLVYVSDRFAGGLYIFDVDAAALNR